MRTVFIFFILIAGCSSNGDKVSENEIDLAQDTTQLTTAMTIGKSGISDENSAGEFEIKIIDEQDSIVKFLEFIDRKPLEKELNAHKLIWQLSSVRKLATFVREKSGKIGDTIVVATMTDLEATENSQSLIIALYEVHPTSHITRLDTYRVTDKSLIEKYDSFKDTWKKYVETEGESFEMFFEKFKLDSVFQLERVKFPFLREGVDTSNDEGADKFNKEYIKKVNWRYANFYYDESYATRVLDAYTQKIKIQPNTAVIEIRGVDNGIWIDYFFEKKESKWMLISEKDSSN